MFTRCCFDFHYSEEDSKIVHQILQEGHTKTFSNCRTQCVRVLGLCRQVGVYTVISQVIVLFSVCNMYVSYRILCHSMILSLPKWLWEAVRKLEIKQNETILWYFIPCSIFFSVREHNVWQDSLEKSLKIAGLSFSEKT